MALALISAGNAKAQELDYAEDDSVLLQTLILGGGRTPVDKEQSGKAITVITGEELEQRQVRYVADALRQVPGFAVSRMGSFGSTTQVRVRGAEGNHLLVMIDGVEASEASTGEFDFGSLLVDDIERIEVLRGPQSAFWGSNALAGVVNIVTRRGKRDGVHASTRGEIGSDGTRLGGFSVSGGAENFDMALSGVYRGTDGFNASRFGSEEDGDLNRTFNGRFNWDLTPDLVIDGTFRHVNRRSDTDPQDYTYLSPTYGYVIDGDTETATREWLRSIGLTHTSPGGALTQKVRYSATDTRRDNYEDGVMISWTEGTRENATYQATYELIAGEAVHLFTGGYEWERESFSPSHLTQTFERATHSVVGEYRGAFYDQFFVNAAVRNDWNDRFADAITYSLSGAWKIPGTGSRLHASVGTGVTNPTFYEQFGYSPSSFSGNPDLLPEKSFGWDVGIEQTLFDGRLVIDVTYFNQNLENEIATVYGPAPDYLSSPINREGVSLRQGVEVSATIDFFNGFRATGTYTWLDATEQTLAGGPRLKEIRRPRHTASLNASYRFLEDRAEVFGEVIYNGEMLDNAFVPSLPSQVTMDAYTIVNTGGSFKLTDNVEVYGRVENLFDEDYEEVFTYATQGRTSFVGLRARF